MPPRRSTPSKPQPAVPSPPVDRPLRRSRRLGGEAPEASPSSLIDSPLPRGRRRSGGLPENSASPLLPEPKRKSNGTGDEGGSSKRLRDDSSGSGIRAGEEFNVPLLGSVDALHRSEGRVVQYNLRGTGGVKMASDDDVIIIEDNEKGDGTSRGQASVTMTTFHSENVQSTQVLSADALDCGTGSTRKDLSGKRNANVEGHNRQTIVGEEDESGAICVSQKSLFDAQEKMNGKKKVGLEDELSMLSVDTLEGNPDRRNSRRVSISAADKGKWKSVVCDDGFPINLNDVPIGDSSTSRNVKKEPIFEYVNEEPILNEMNSLTNLKDLNLSYRREAVRNKAIELAPKFAFYKPEEVESSEVDIEDQEDNPVLDGGDWPGPYSTAMKIIEEQAKKSQARNMNGSSKGCNYEGSKIFWKPSKAPNNESSMRKPASLRNLCMRVLVENSEELESLDGIPDIFKLGIMKMLCDSRKMNVRLLSSALMGNFSDISLSDCSWMSEQEFEKIFRNLRTENLESIQLDLCGRCFPDYILHSTLLQKPSGLQSLRRLSLKGAYRLTDDGLEAIASFAPSLSSVNLCQCSLLTSVGIIKLSEKLRYVLRVLNIDECQSIEAMQILPSLTKISQLEILSMARITSVTNKFVHGLVPVLGANIKELSFANCNKLTSSSTKIIGAMCPQLSALDLRNLKHLNDSTLGHLANGCRMLRRLKFGENVFSDEAVAAFLEASGGSLIELFLNKLQKVGDHTALAISHCCTSELRSLDLSFCRNMTNEALGLIVDSCISLRILKIFGCAQITDVFLNGHSNNLVTIIGVDGQNVLPDQFERLGIQ